MSNVVYYKGENYDEAVKGERVVVDFYADWCGPCKMVGPVLEQISEEKGIKVLKVDVDTYGEIAGRFGVRSIPTILIYANGELVNQTVGAAPKNKLEKIIFEK